jgi:hypothetical protein
MESARRTIFIVGTLIFSLQILARLLKFSTGIAFLVGSAASGIYVVTKNDMSIKSLASGFLAFVASGAVVSITGKVLVLDTLCQTSMVAGQQESGFSGVLAAEQACRGFAENFLILLRSDLLGAWYFWLPASAIGVSGAYGYSIYGEQND